jgi:hypothetical protein
MFGKRSDEAPTNSCTAGPATIAPNGDAFAGGTPVPNI